MKVPYSPSINGCRRDTVREPLRDAEMAKSDMEQDTYKLTKHPATSYFFNYKGKGNSSEENMAHTILVK